MSTWIKKSRDAALASRPPNAGPLHSTGRFQEGAAWQREALLSDEAVERAARGIQASHDRGDWDEELPVVQGEYRAMARVALTAAIGGGDE